MISDSSKIIYNYRPRNFEVSSAEYIKKTTGKLSPRREYFIKFFVFLIIL